MITPPVELLPRGGFPKLFLLFSIISCILKAYPKIFSSSTVGRRASGYLSLFPAVGLLPEALSKKDFWVKIETAIRYFTQVKQSDILPK